MAGGHPGKALPPSALRRHVSNTNAPLIQAMSARFQRVGVSPTFFTSQVYLAHGFTEALLATYLRPLQNIDDDVKLERILLLGIKQRIFRTIRGMTAAQFYKFLSYVRNPAGQSAISQMSIIDRLQRRGGGNFTAEQMGWLAMIDAQRTDYANETGDVRGRHEFIITDLEWRLQDAKATMENELAAARQKYLPCGEYIPLETYEFNLGCWNEFLNMCLAKNVVGADLSEESLAEAVEIFGDVVRQRHLLDFVMQGERQNQLAEYVNTKVEQFENEGEKRSAKRFRGLLATVSLEPPAQTPPQADGDAIFNTRFADPDCPCRPTAPL